MIIKRNLILQFVFAVFLFILPFHLYSCNNNDKLEDVTITTDEVTMPNVIEKSGKILVSWKDPASDFREIQVVDLQTNERKSVSKYVEKVEFDIIDEALLSYRYEIKVIGLDGKESDGVIARLMKNWAQNIYPQIDYNTDEEPQKGMFFKNRPANKVLAFDIRNDESVAKLAASVMQGVLNQDVAQIYLIWQEQDIIQLKDANVSYDNVSSIGVSKNGGFSTLFSKYRDYFEYLVVWDEKQPWSWSMAQMISAQEKGIPVTETLKAFIESELGFNNLKVWDIREKWSSNKDAYSWALQQYAGKFHPMLSFSGGLRSDYIQAPWKLCDYAAASKGFVFWLDDTKQEDKEIMDMIFNVNSYPVGASVFGYGMNSNGDELNKITNVHNMGFVVSDYYANGSFWCCFPNKAFKQRRGVASEVKPGKIYVAISLSDGDNIQFDSNALYQIFKEGKDRGKVPLGITLAAGLQELNPKLLEFYYKNMTPNDELTAGPSGFQFIYGDYYAQSGKYTEWLEMNKRWLSTAGFHTAHLWNTDEQKYFKQYMESSGVDAVLDGWDKTHTAGASCKFVSGVVRLNQGTHCRKEGDVYRDLMSISPSLNKPVFRHVYLLTGYYGFDGGKVVLYERLIRELERLERDCPNTYEYLLPMDLAASIKAYIENGGVY